MVKDCCPLTLTLSDLVTHLRFQSISSAPSLKESLHKLHTPSRRPKVIIKRPTITVTHSYIV